MKPDELGIIRNTGVAPDSPRIADLEGCVRHSAMVYGGRSLRDAIGLDNQIDAASATEDRLGIRVTPSEAERIDRSRSLRKVAKGQLKHLVATNPGVVGATWSYAESTYDVYVTGRSPVELSTEGEDGRLRIHRLDSDLDLAEVGELKTALLAGHNIEHGDKGLGITYDPTCGVLLALVESAVQEDALQLVITERGLTPSTLVTVVAPGAMMGQASRNDYHNPNTGGLRYQIRASGAAGGEECTSAIPFRSASSGNLYAITAAHCLPNPQHTSTEVIQYDWNAQWWQGKFDTTKNINLWAGSYYIYGGGMDVAWALIRSGSSGGTGGQAKSMNHGANHTYQSMGWWQWDQSMADDGGLFSSGDTVCHSGINWAGSPCGEIIDDNWVGQNCEPNDGPCHAFDGMVLTTMRSYGGDSGGTVWSHKDNGVWYSGVVAASSKPDEDPLTVFSHIGNLDDLVAYLDSPVGMY